MWPWVAALCHLGAAPANRRCVLVPSCAWEKGGQGKARFHLGRKKGSPKPKRQNHHLPLQLHRLALMGAHNNCVRAGSCWWLPSEAAPAWCHTQGLVLKSVKWYHNKNLSVNQLKWLLSFLQAVIWVIATSRQDCPLWEVISVLWHGMSNGHVNAVDRETWEFGAAGVGQHGQR